MPVESCENAGKVSARSETTVSRLPWLDVLRGAAVLLVLCRHMGFLPPRETSTFVYRAFHMAQFVGWIGVDLFFVLSGFLVSGILFRQYIKTGQIRPWQFLIRRGFKIYPAFWFLIIITALCASMGRHPLPIEKVLIEVFFLQNYLNGLWTHTWSLAVEEHCYIVLCVVFLGFTKFCKDRANPFRSVPALVIGMSVAVLTLRLVQRVNPEKDLFITATTPTHLRCDAFLAGVLVAYYYHFSSNALHHLCVRYRYCFFFTGLVCFAPICFWDVEKDPVVWTWFYTTNLLGGSCLLLWALGMKQRTGRLLGLVAAVGTYSYSIYLWHFMIGVKLLGIIFYRYQIPGGWATFVPLYFAISIGFGIVMSYLIERPALYLRERWFPAEVSPKILPGAPACETKNSASVPLSAHPML